MGDDQEHHTLATNVMRQHGHHVLADMVDALDQRHTNIGNECATCGPHPETWPCERWLETNHLVTRWLVEQIHLNQQSEADDA